MNTKRYLLVVSMLILGLTKISPAQDAVLPGASFVSPNARYCVQVKGIDGLPHFVIKDLETGRTDDSIISTGPLYLHWAANSRSFVTVEHIAKGSYGRVVFLDGETWSNIKVDPPWQGKLDASVINLQLGSDSVHYRFSVTKLTTAWVPIDYLFCDLDVSLATGKVSNVKWTPASEAELANTPGPDAPVCVPPMPREPYSGVCPGDRKEKVQN